MRDALIAVEMSSDWLLSFRMRWQVTHAAVVRDVHAVEGGTLAFKGGPYGVYKPCLIGTADDRAAGSWRAPTLGLGRLLDGQHVTLLKIDIDSHDGALLAEALHMIRQSRVELDAIMVELGDGRTRIAACNRPENARKHLCVTRSNRPVAHASEGS